MTTTTTAFTAIVRDLARMQSITAQTPTAKHAIAYYRTNIGKITSLDQFVGDYRLLSFALNAYGLGDQIKSIALVRKVIEGGVSDPQSLANKLRDPRWKSFAAAFDFKGGPPLAFSQSSRVQMTVQSYVQQKLESDQGAQNAGVQLALYFRRIGPTITNSYEVMGDKNLLKVAQTILGLPASFNAANIDAIAASIKKAMPISDLRNPQVLERLTERFTAMFDLNYGDASDSRSNLAATVDAGATVSAAAAILGGIVASNNQTLSSLASGAGSAGLLGSDLLMSIQRQKLGGA